MCWGGHRANSNGESIAVTNGSCPDSWLRSANAAIICLKIMREKECHFNLFQGSSHYTLWNKKVQANSPGGAAWKKDLGFESEILTSLISFRCGFVPLRRGKGRSRVAGNIKGQEISWFFQNHNFVVDV